MPNQYFESGIQLPFRLELFDKRVIDKPISSEKFILSDVIELKPAIY